MSDIAQHMPQIVAAYLVYLAALLSPGPAVMAIVSTSIGEGRRAGLAMAAGVFAGSFTWAMAASIGLAALLTHYAGVLQAVKIAGGLYLLYLAYKAWTAPAEAPKPAAAARGEGVRLFLGGIALTLGNPKVMVFFVSILPLVVDLSAITPLLFVEIAVLTMVIINTTLLGYAYAADRARRLVSSPQTMRRINRFTGGVMAGAATVIATRG